MIVSRALVAAVLLLLLLASGGAMASRRSAMWNPQTAEELEELLVGVRKSIAGMQDDIAQIFQYILQGPGQHQTYNRLATMTDTIGNRLSGSPQFNAAIQWITEQANAEGLANVHGEDAVVPSWYRGQESAFMLQPHFKPLGMLGLGTSIGTPNITAEALVVQSFDELNQQAAANNTAGKIIVFNQQCDWDTQPVSCYSITATYRVNGASAASQAGAVASLIRSLASYSLYTPHTGVQDYGSSTPIPTACITVEDADELQRIQDRGQKIVLTLAMEAHMLPSVTQQNFVAEVTGVDYPDEIVLVSGHLDSWDVGNGFMDDGGGAFISWEALSVVNALGLKPKRTLRFVGWACEEFGGIGAQQYYEAHVNETDNMDLVLESDMGTFTPTGIEFTGNAAATAVMQEIVQLLAPVNATLLVSGGGGEDIGPWMNAGVPGGSIANDNQRYFWFHHSNADTAQVYTPDELDLAAAVWTVTAYAVANLDTMLPRNSTAAF